MSTASPAALEAAFLAACRLELDALKPGNVHRFADGHGMTVDLFEAAAVAAAGPIARPGASPGRRVRDAVAASVAATGCNTNLGIILLAAPLLMAAEAGGVGHLASVLAGAGVEDARLVFEAIRIANPGGLGRSDEEDVANPPTRPLVEIMALAAPRDRIARQYATGYADVLAIGAPALAEAAAAGATPGWAMTRAYMTLLSRFPDTHVARKFGVEVADAVMREARTIAVAEETPSARAALAVFDGALKRRGLNPGATADLTVASALARCLFDGDGHNR